MQLDKEVILDTTGRNPWTTGRINRILNREDPITTRHRVADRAYSEIKVFWQQRMILVVRGRDCET